MIVFALGLGVTSATSIPPQQALLASLVEAEELPTAVALNSMTYNIARAAGPVAGAASVEYLGIPASFLLNSASYLVFVGALLVIHPRAQEIAERGKSRLRDSLHVLRADPRDPNRLDPDRDGIACRSNPTPRDLTPVPR